MKVDWEALGDNWLLGVSFGIGFGLGLGVAMSFIMTIAALVGGGPA